MEMAILWKVLRDGTLLALEMLGCHVIVEMAYKMKCHEISLIFLSYKIYLQWDDIN